MEGIHFLHFEEPWTDPLTDPALPPDPGIPQGPVPDPECAGPRNLWVLANPSSIDCDVDQGFTLIISPDFKCIEITQLNQFDGPGIDDPPTEIERGCDDAAFITIAVTDCLCGGVATVDIFTENCDVDCAGYAVDGPDRIGGAGFYDYSVNVGGETTWSVSGTGVTIDSKSGRVTATGNVCGVITITASNKCCGEASFLAQAASGFYDVVTRGRGSCDACNPYNGIVKDWSTADDYFPLQYTIALGPCDVSGLVSCVPQGTHEIGSAFYSGDFWEHHTKSIWKCPP
jgi:hypothetical protein